MPPYLPLPRLFPHLPASWILAEEPGWIAIDKPCHVLARRRLRPGRKGVANELLARLALERGLGPDDPAPLVWSRVLEAIDGSPGDGGVLASQSSGVVLVTKDVATREAFEAHVGAGEVGLTWLAGVTPWRGRGPALSGLAAGLEALGVKLTEVKRCGDRGLVQLKAAAGRDLRPVELLRQHGLFVAGVDARIPKRGIGLVDSGGEPGAVDRPMWHLAAVSWPGRKIEAPLPVALTRWLMGETEPVSERLTRELPRRHALAHGDMGDCFRLLDGEKSLTVDRYGPDIVVSVCVDLPDAFVDRLGFQREVAATRALACALGEHLQPRRVYLKIRPREASTVVDAVTAGLVPTEPVWGEPLGKAEPGDIAVEWGLRYRVELGTGLSTGIFLDQRDNRRWLLDQSHDRSVLNTFSYTCAFSVAAGAGGARRTVSIDASAGALDRGRENFALNGLTDPERYDFIRGDVLDWLPRMHRRGDRFDTVILDPPSYSKVKSRRFAAQRDYAELVEMAARLVSPGGHLLACINHSRVDRPALQQMVRDGCEKAGRKLDGVEHRRPAVDHPDARMKSVLVKLV